MRVCMITPHLPPEQAANALLPRLLGDELAEHGVHVQYVAHPRQVREPDRALEGRQNPDDVVWVEPRGRGWIGRSVAGAVMAAGRIALSARHPIRTSDLIHLHGNGFIIEVGRSLAEHYRKPCVITLYGTDVWHHDPERHARFARAVRGASARVFYSHGLLEFAKGLGLAPDPSTVIYAPVPSTFRPPEAGKREEIRHAFGIDGAPQLLTVKRLHAVAGHDVLLQALPLVLREHPGARLWIVGRGHLRSALEAQAQELGVAAHVEFTGLLDNASLWRYYAAADLFVLPSRLESWGTVMLEALASGTPVVATDTVGALEVHQQFPDDVMLAENGNPAALAAAVCGALALRRRVGVQSHQKLQTEFSVAACAARYLDVYRRVTHAV